MVSLPLPERGARMAAAIRAYARQTHEDRELVIVLDQGAGRQTAMEDVTALGRADIRLVLPEQSLTLGALRNLSVAHASGDILCQWDDDDLHHPERAAAQLSAMNVAGQAATILQDVMLYREAGRALCWTNWAATPAGGHPGTLMCRRAAMPFYPETGARARQSEDLAVVESLRAADLLHLQADMPHLLVYVTHGANTASAAHHAMLAERLAISRGLLLRREARLRAGLAAFDLGGIKVEGKGGAAFTL